MALSFVGYGAAAVGTGSVAVPYPTVTAGNMMVLFVENKYPNNPPTDPAGWNLVKQQTGGAGSAGVDTGNTYMTVYAKIADGTETGNLTVTIPSGNSAVGRMCAWAKEPDSSWSTVYGIGYAQDSAFTGLAIPFSGANLRLNDALMVAGGINTNDYTYAVFDFAASGLTFSAKSSVSSATSAGDDSQLIIYRGKVASGETAATLNFSVTASGSAASAPAGAFVLVVLREIGPSVRSMPIKRKIKNIVCLPKRPPKTDYYEIFEGRIKPPS